MKKFTQEDPKNSVAIFNDGQLQGFATFEVLVGVMPKDYEGNLKPKRKTLFVQQFTTVTNYGVKNTRADEELLLVIEKKAAELKCDEIWEALAVKHPYGLELNTDYDAFGFYLNHGFRLDKNIKFVWRPDKGINIPCYLFRRR